MQAPNAGRTGAIVVIGSAAALGGAYVRRLIEDQAEPLAWITYRSDAAPAQELASTLPGVRAMRCDVTVQEDLQALVADVASRAAHVDALVHAALDPAVGPLLELGTPTVAQVVAASGLSLLSLVEAFDELLSPGATVIYTTSIGSHRVIRGYGAVGTAKAVGESIVRYLAAELAERDVRVNAISAGPFASKAAARVVADVETLMQATDEATPRGRRLDLAEIAEVAAFLVHPRASGVTGQVVTVDAGIFNRWAL
jgi:enoyl-[acyl-carrier-protein] reductase (NADH)